MDRSETYTLLDRIMDHFKSINEKKGLTEEDRKQIKKFYLESFITPEARKHLQKHFPEKFPAEKSAGAHPKQFASRHDSMCSIKLVLVPQSLRIPAGARPFLFPLSKT